MVAVSGIVFKAWGVYIYVCIDRYIYISIHIMFRYLDLEGIARACDRSHARVSSLEVGSFHTAPIKLL